MAALEPIKVIISNFNQVAEGKDLVFVVQNSPTEESMGSHSVSLTPVIYIDSADFRREQSDSYYGLTPQQPVGLKYHGGNLILDRIICTSSDGLKVLEMEAHVDISDNRIKPKSYITWVPQDGIPCEVRVYNHLFTVPEPSDRWEEELNPNSEIIYPNALVDPSVRDMVDAKFVDKWHSNPSLQFERLGYFVVDTDTTFDSVSGQGRLVFNRTVSLKEEVAKKQISEGDAAELKRRKEKQQADKEAKEARMKIALVDLFRLAPEYVGLYSMFDKDGMPTHDAEGKEVTKSALKKLAKERMKHEKILNTASV
jgi:glutaminyl-tRNA synthetase